MYKVPADFTTVVLSGYYCYHLSQEAHALIMILKEFLPILEDSFTQSGDPGSGEKISVMKKAIVDIDPLIDRTIEDMAPFKIMNLQDIADALRARKEDR